MKRLLVLGWSSAKLLTYALILGVFLGMSIALPAWAVTVNYSGEVLIPIGTISFGTPVFGSLSYTVVPPTIDQPTRALYLPEMASSLNAGGETLIMRTDNPLLTSHGIWVYDNYDFGGGPEDGFSALIGFDWLSPSLPELGGKDIIAFELTIRDNDATMFTSTALPTDFSFVDDADFMVIEVLYNPPIGGGWPFGRIANLQFTTVPEPTTMLLFGSGLLGLWVFRKKFRK